MLSLDVMLLGSSAEAGILNNNLTSISGALYGNIGKTTKPVNSSGAFNSRSKFIRPSVNPTTGCNIWGPLCQTGSIVVGVNLTTTVRETTVPCSEYLSAQAESAMPGFLESRGRYANYRPPEPRYQISFGRSPECNSYAHHFLETYKVFNSGQVQATSNVRRNDWNPIITPSGDLTFSNCATDLPQRPEYYTPPGVSNSVVGMGGPGYDYYCCGDCTLDISEIRLLYFPRPTTNSCFMDHGSTTSASILSSNIKNIGHRAASLLTNGSILISDGYT